MLYVTAMDGVPGASFRKAAANNNAFGFSTSEMSHADLGEPKGAFIVCEAYACRVSFGGTTSTATVGMLLSPGDSIYLKQNKWVRTASFINKTAGENTVLQVTMEY